MISLTERVAMAIIVKSFINQYNRRIETFFVFILLCGRSNDIISRLTDLTILRFDIEASEPWYRESKHTSNDYQIRFLI